MIDVSATTTIWNADCMADATNAVDRLRGAGHNAHWMFVAGHYEVRCDTADARLLTTLMSR